MWVTWILYCKVAMFFLQIIFLSVLNSAGMNVEWRNSYNVLTGQKASDDRTEPEHLQYVTMVINWNPIGCVLHHGSAQGECPYLLLEIHYLFTQSFTCVFFFLSTNKIHLLSQCYCNMLCVRLTSECLVVSNLTGCL